MDVNFWDEEAKRIKAVLDKFDEGKTDDPRKLRMCEIIAHKIEALKVDGWINRDDHQAKMRNVTRKKLMMYGYSGGDFQEPSVAIVSDLIRRENLKVINTEDDNEERFVNILDQLLLLIDNNDSKTPYTDSEWYHQMMTLRNMTQQFRDGYDND